MHRARRISAGVLALIVLTALAGCAKEDPEPPLDLSPVYGLANEFYYYSTTSDSVALLATMTATVQYAEGATAEFQPMTKEDVAAIFTPAWWGEAADQLFWADSPSGTSDAATISAHLRTSGRGCDLTFGAIHTATGWLITQIRVVEI